MNLEQIDTNTKAGKALAQFAELLKVGGCEGELRIGRAFGEALVAEIAALKPPQGYVPERSVLVAATQLRKLASDATPIPMARSAYIKAAEMVEMAVIAAPALIEEGVEEIGVKHITTLRAVLSSLGMTPIDETKVAHKEEKEEDEFDKMMGGGKPN